jgi:hypothetical protein
MTLLELRHQTYNSIGTKAILSIQPSLFELGQRHMHNINIFKNS